MGHARFYYKKNTRKIVYSHPVQKKLNNKLKKLSHKLLTFKKDPLIPIGFLCHCY